MAEARRAALVEEEPGRRGAVEVVDRAAEVVGRDDAAVADVVRAAAEEVERAVRAARSDVLEDPDRRLGAVPTLLPMKVN